MPPTPNLSDLAIKLAKEGPVKTLPTPRLIRLLFNGVYIASTTQALMIWEHPYYPQYYLPAAALLESPTASDFKLEKGAPISSPEDSTAPIAHHYTLTIGTRSTSEIIIFAPNLAGPASLLSNLAKINFSALDRWFEEDAPIYVHPKDPFKRIDILPSTRRVQVFVHGTQVADAVSSMHLYETGLPVRFYLPVTSVDAGVLRPSETKTVCPYKGEAEYFSVEVSKGDGGGGEREDGGLVRDVVWFYDRPTLESAKIEGLLCFYNEKVDIKIDGEWLPKS